MSPSLCDCLLWLTQRTRHSTPNHDSAILPDFDASSEKEKHIKRPPTFKLSIAQKRTKLQPKKLKIKRKPKWVSADESQRDVLSSKKEKRYKGLFKKK